DVGYQVLVVDPEGDYTNADFVTHVGNPAHAPLLEDVTDALNDPKRSIVVNLLGVPLADRPAYFAKLMPLVLQEKAKTGRPHWLVIEKPHHFLPENDATTDVANLLPDRGLMFVTVHADSVDHAALGNIGTLIVIGAPPADTVTKFCTIH